MSFPSSFQFTRSRKLKKFEGLQRIITLIVRNGINPAEKRKLMHFIRIFLSQGVTDFCNVRKQLKNAVLEVCSMLDLQDIRS